MEWIYKRTLFRTDGYRNIYFSTYADFPEPIKLWNFYRMNSFGYWVGTLGIPVISNVRWGTEETWRYCFDGNPRHSMLALGTVASGIRLLRNRPLFEAGLFKMVELLQPHTIVAYGSTDYPCFDILREQESRLSRRLSYAAPDGRFQQHFL